MSYSKGQDKKTYEQEKRSWWRFYLGLPDLLSILSKIKKS
jgi:hypothetical protein